MNLVIFGPPGAGKGTQAKNLEKKLNNFQVSTGDMLRDEIKKDSEIGKKIINYMNDGKFVDNEIVNNIMKKIIFDPKKKNKLIFDGYPRTLDQAKNLNCKIITTEKDFERLKNLKTDNIQYIKSELKIFDEEKFIKSVI